MPPFPRTILRAALCLTAGVAVTACTALGPPPVRNGLAPVLLPLDALLAEVPAIRSGEAGNAALVARANALRARAALMRGPVNDAATRARLAEAIANRPPGG